MPFPPSYQVLATPLKLTQIIKIWPNFLGGLTRPSCDWLFHSKCQNWTKKTFVMRRQNSDEKKAKRSDVSVNSSKRNVEHQNRNDQVNSSSFIAHQASSSSIWAKLLLSTSKLSTSKLSGLERSDASLRTADNPNIAVRSHVTCIRQKVTLTERQSSIFL